MSNSNEWPAVWCLCSIGLCLPIIKRPIRDYPPIVTHYWRIALLELLAQALEALAVVDGASATGRAIGPFHWNNRKLSFQELCRIQTFPDDLWLGSGRTEMQRMLGTAVLSLIAEVLAREIRRQFFDAPLE